MKPLKDGGLVPGGGRVLLNSKYQVIVSATRDRYDGRPMTELSIRRIDRKPIMDWRDLQWLKNQILGPEREAVQVFPAESRLVDTSNQYYLYAYDNVAQFPFGFTNRLVTERMRIQVEGGAPNVQRPFADHVRPNDLEANEEKGRQIVQELRERQRGE